MLPLQVVWFPPGHKAIIHDRHLLPGAEGKSLFHLPIIPSAFNSKRLILNLHYRAGMSGTNDPISNREEREYRDKVINLLTHIANRLDSINETLNEINGKT